MREKLIELLKEISYDQKLGWYDLWDMRDGAEDIADLLIANGVTVQEWISVNKGEHSHTGNRLIALADGFVTVGYQSGNGVWVYWRNGMKHQSYEVTHWMPLPEPPKGE